MFFYLKKTCLSFLFKFFPHDGPFLKLTPQEVLVISTFHINVEFFHLFVLSKNIELFKFRLRRERRKEWKCTFKREDVE